MTSTAIQNRLKKNWQQLKPWADRLGIEAFRLYDRDIPEYPSIIEIYRDSAVLWDRRDDEIDQGKERQFAETLEALGALGFSKEKIIVKRRARQGKTEGGTKTQYYRLDKTQAEREIREGDVKLLVNLTDYLDTGLFLDHRLTRKRIGEHIAARSKRRERSRLLNLFCYTGSVSVYAAKAGAITTNVDMSPTYLEWAERNFVTNGLLTSRHRFINEDVLAWTKEGAAKATGPYEFIFCDPPTFSNSKKMAGTWEVQRDHKWLIEQCLEALTADGVLLFSANRRDFVLNESLRDLREWQVREISKDTLPKDFHDAKIRRVFQFSRSGNPSSS